LLIYGFTSSQAVLFTINQLNPFSLHTMTVFNLPDTRFNDTSQLTFSSLNIVVLDTTGESLVLEDECRDI
jgi:hypothetical protein